MGEQICSAPQQAGLRSFHFQGKILHHLFEIAGVFGKIAPLGTHISIMKTEIRHAKNIKHLKGHICLELGQSHL